MKGKNFIPCLFLKDKKCVRSFKDDTVVSDDPVSYAQELAFYGADALLVFDLSSDDNSHEEALLILRHICQKTDFPVIGAGNVKRLEDIKKILYTGCKYAVLNMAKSTNVALVEEASKRFGKNKIMVCVDSTRQAVMYKQIIADYTACIISLDDISRESLEKSSFISFVKDTDSSKITSVLSEDKTVGVSGPMINDNASDILAIKNKCKESGMEDIFMFSSDYSFSDFKLNSDGHLPVVVQDAKTDAVLMVAYMNEEAFNLTLKSGVMTFYSRSRKEIWVKGKTSGNYQFVRSLSADCDMDTLLAKVTPIGPACHTGAVSCFFNEICSKPSDDTNPYHVFEKEMNTIMDRKLHPKEGSYTNYLFDKGIDKILKKVGEEATEIVIAAKNPEKEEVKYEIADFLYHVMVLMVECGLTWEDVTEELNNR